MRFVRWYNEILKRKPKTTQMASAFLLTYSSDSICQYIEKPEENSYFEWFSNRRASICLFLVLVSLRLCFIIGTSF